jgi:hypothetical protein
MPCSTPEQQREYQRKWCAARRAAYLAGKSCVACGATEELEVDHIDPATKISHNVWSWAEARRKTELAKCQVLCRSCHREKSLKAYPQRQHGTRPMYRKERCRCTACRAWRRNARRAERMKQQTH